MEILEVVEGLLERIDTDKNLRSLGVSISGFVKSKSRPIKIGEDYDFTKKSKIADLKMQIREKYGYGIIEEIIDCEKEKSENGKVVRKTYLKI